MEHGQGFDVFFRMSPVGIVISSIDGVFLDLNDVACELLGFRRDEIIGKTSLEIGLVAPDDRQRLFDAAKRGPLARASLQLRTRNGVRHAIVAVQRAELHGSERWITTFLDVTEHDRVADQLRSFLESAPDAIVITDAGGTIVLVNAQTERLFGYTRDELVGKNVDALVPQRLRAHHAAHRESYARKPRVRLMGKAASLYASRKDGSELPVEISLSSMATQEGLLVISAIRDVTERERQVRRDRQHHDEREHLAAIVDSSDDAIITESPDGIVTSWNKGAERMFGWTADEIVGGPFTRLLADPSKDDHAEILRRVLAGEHVDHFEVERRTRDGRVLHVSVAASPLRDPQGKIVAVSRALRDITAAKVAEQRLRQSLKEKEVLLQEVHHRVKNNLQVIASLINLQIRKLEDRAALAALEECRSRVLAIALVHERLYQSKDFSRVDSAQYLRQIVEAAFLASRTSPDRVRLVLDIAPIALSVEHAIPCGLIVNELIANALEHAFPDGRTGEVRIRLASTESRVTLEVTDNGVGLPVGFAFDSSPTLGLQLVRTLVDQLSASIDVVRSGGTSITIAFAR